jgi:acyl-CoA reductase-like NAD-dependent aldehyde dehydrogenase
MSTERILVHEDIAEKFTEALKTKVQQIFGSVENTPILVTEASATRNRGLVDNAVSHGATKVDIFSATDKAANASGHEAVPTHMRPVILTGVDKSMDLYGGESFGPSVSLYTYKDEEKMVKMANDTEYGLSASIFSENLLAAFRLAERLDSGAVHINSMSVHDEFDLPHGGFKKSGFGRFNGYQGMDEFLQTKSITWMQ